VLFPALDSGIAGSAPPEADSAAHSHREGLHGRVLVVDDDEAAGGFMEDLFASWGLDATLARNGVDGCETFAADPGRFDLVLLDQTMPRMTGLEAASRMRALRADVPLVLYTGYSDDLTSEQVEAAGLQALLRKPVDTEELLALVRELLAASAGNN
jgi:CheY-like chemotaxis protein